MFIYKEMQEIDDRIETIIKKLKGQMEEHDCHRTEEDGCSFCEGTIMMIDLFSDIRTDLQEIGAELIKEE